MIKDINKVNVMNNDKEGQDVSFEDDVVNEEDEVEEDDFQRVNVVVKVENLYDNKEDKDKIVDFMKVLTVT